MKRTINYIIFLSLVLGTSSDYITGDVKIVDILRVYYESYQWVSVCSITESAAHAVCHQLGYVQAKAINSTYKNQSMSYSFTRIECPTVSDYKQYGELHILRCSLEGPIETPNYCYPVTIECDLEKLTHNPYKGQVSIEFEKSNTLSHGPLEVFLDGSRGKYVCYNSKFTNQAADSACRQLGYTGSSSHKREENSERDVLLFSNYSCTQSSFACFSHCIVESSYHFEPCQDRVFLHCEFNTSLILSSSSGSLNECALTRTSVSPYEIATWSFTGAVGLIIIIVLISLLLAYCLYKKYRGRNGYQCLNDRQCCCWRR